RTMSRFVDVSTFTSRTDTAAPSSIIGLQLTPPFVDFVIAPPTRIWSKKSPRPRYNVFGLRPNATEPPPLVGRSSVSTVHVLFGEVQLLVRQSPPPEVRK